MEPEPSTPDVDTQKLLQRLGSAALPGPSKTQSAKVSTSTPVGSVHYKRSSSTSRKNRLALDPNWKENLKRRRILLQTEFSETKVNDAEDPIREPLTHLPTEAAKDDEKLPPKAVLLNVADLEARIAKKRQQLQREEEHRAYVDSLKDSIEQWKTGCIAALEDLTAGAPNKTTMGEVLQAFQIPPQILGYDPDNECFD